MINEFSRTELIFGKEGMAKLAAAKVAVFGIGGVGGYAVEALARSGIGSLALFDDDKICLTNLNRQLHATRKTVGRYKVEVAKERIAEIAPTVETDTFKMFYLPETSTQVDLAQYDYVIDAIDTVSGKIELAVQAYRSGVRLISSMGAGNKVNAAALEVADIYETSVCPLAKVMRHELRQRGIPSLKVVYSKEPPLAPQADLLISCEENCICPPGTTRKCTQRRQIPGSNAFVPAVAGLIIAGEVIKELSEYSGYKEESRNE
jgi:tRNA A37 threonylcarbamoyladenosine dehydratase